jgi:hypothetical protein
MKLRNDTRHRVGWVLCSSLVLDHISLNVEPPPLSGATPVSVFTAGRCHGHSSHAHGVSLHYIAFERYGLFQVISFGVSS